LYPLTNFAKFKEKGGIDGSISWLPLDNIITALRELYASREHIKQDLYEITGISDIIRGASNPNETAAAQKIKGRFASMRLSKKQNLVSKHARNVIALMGEVIAEHFSKETLIKITGMEVTDEMMEVLQNDAMRNFLVDIETDSTIALDEEEEKRSASEFLKTSAEFMQASLQIAQSQPMLTPLLGEMMMFGVRRYRAGRDLEEQFEQTMQQIQEKMQADMQAAQNQSPQKSPEEKKAELESKIKIGEHQLDSKIKQDDHQQDMKMKQESHVVDLATKANQ
jgi:hypothetical protein